MNERDRRIVTNAERLVYQNRYARVYDNDVTFPGDHKGRYLKFTWLAPYGVAVLPILGNSRIYLVRNFRYAADSYNGRTRIAGGDRADVGGVAADNIGQNRRRADQSHHAFVRGS
jgi:hypothetical protein